MVYLPHGQVDVKFYLPNPKVYLLQICTLWNYTGIVLVWAGRPMYFPTPVQISSAPGRWAIPIVI